MKDSPLFKVLWKRFAPFLFQGNGYLLSFSKNECFLFLGIKQLSTQILQGFKFIMSEFSNLRSVMCGKQGMPDLHRWRESVVLWVLAFYLPLCNIVKKLNKRTKVICHFISQMNHNMLFAIQETPECGWVMFGSCYDPMPVQVWSSP